QPDADRPGHADQHIDQRGHQRALELRAGEDLPIVVQPHPLTLRGVSREVSVKLSRSSWSIGMPWNRTRYTTPGPRNRYGVQRNCLRRPDRGGRAGLVGRTGAVVVVMIPALPLLAREARSPRRLIQHA